MQVGLHRRGSRAKQDDMDLENNVSNDSTLRAKDSSYDSLMDATLRAVPTAIAPYHPLPPMLPIRKQLPHDVPSWIDPTQEAFFLTINGKRRNVNQFANPKNWEAILESIALRENRGDWHWNLILAMPDHLHGIVFSPQHFEMRKMIEEWKRWLARQCKFEWQDGFFEHRLRSEESAQEKAIYIRKNPIRAGLIDESESWPYQRDWKNLKNQA